MTIPRLKTRSIKNIQSYMETSKKDRLHYPHHNFVPNILKLNQSARTTVIQLFRTSSPFLVEVAFGHTVKDTLQIHVIDGRANIRCAREIENAVIDTEAKFTTSWAITKPLLDRYRITIRPLDWPLLLVMEEIHPEAPSPFPTIWPSQQPAYPLERSDNQQYAFLSARFAYFEKETFPLSITVLGNNAEILMNTIVCPRGFIKHYASDTHNLKEDDIMRGLDHFIAYPLLKSVLATKTIVAYNVENTLNKLRITTEEIHSAIELKNLPPTTAHYAEFSLHNLAEKYLPANDRPVFPIKSTMIEADITRNIFTSIKKQFVLSTITENPYAHLVKNMKDQAKSTTQFKLPNIPKTSKTTCKRTDMPAEPPSRRRSPPENDDNPYPPKNRKKNRPEDLFAELDDSEQFVEINDPEELLQDTRTVHEREPTASTSNKTPFSRPLKTLGFIKIRTPTDIAGVCQRKATSPEKLKDIRQQRKPDSKPPKVKENPPPQRPTGPQKTLEHPFNLMGMVELNTDSFLRNLEAIATKKEATNQPIEDVPEQLIKNDPVTKRMERIRTYVREREMKNADPGHPSVIPNGFYTRATADYDDSQYTWDYFMYIQYFDGEHPKSLQYSKIPPMPKLPDCGLMEILYIPVRYRGRSLKNIHLIASYIVREYRDARKIRTYSLFTRKIQPPIINTLSESSPKS